MNTQTARAQARALGEKIFQGVPCRRGHDGVRYTCSRNCVECLRDADRAKRANRAKGRERKVTEQERAQAARALGLKTYQGKPCKRGHSGERYASHRACVECGRDRTATLHATRRAADPEKYLAHQAAAAVAAAARRNSQRAADPEKYRATRRKYSGLPEPTRPEPATCECCRRPPGDRAMHLDHCHVSGEFRGWLCSNCNTALGKLGDDLKGVESLRNYLMQRVLSAAA